MKREGALHLPGAPELMAEAFTRSFVTTVDFSQLDHIAMASRQLGELRVEFGVQPRCDGFDGGTGGPLAALRASPQPWITSW